MMRFIKHDIYYKIIAFIAIIHLELTINLISAHREHKVHNIVLYPDKHSWCKTLAIKQVISYPGCKSEEIDNNVCVGTCFSYSIPHTEPSDPGEVIVPYCDSCQPSDTTWHHVTLECTKNSIDSSSTPPHLVKRVQIINNCSCTSCEKSLSSTIHQTNQFNDEDDNDLIMSHVHHDVPDVLKILKRNNSEQSSATGLGTTSKTMIGSSNSGNTDGINSSITNENNNNDNNGNNNSNHNNLNNGAHNYDKFKDIKQILNHKIITLLKNIQENNSVHDKEQLMDLLRMIQGPNSKLNDKNIEDFVNSLHSENIELDIPRLREILIKFEHSKFYEKKRKYSNLNSYINDNGNNQNLDGISSSSISENNGMETTFHNQNNGNNNNNNNYNGEGDNDQQQEQQHQHHLHTSNHHHHSNNNNNNNNHHHLHHHIGENVVGHGHLTRGPHGALVIEPNHYHDDNNDNMSIDQDQNNKSDSHDDDDIVIDDDDLNHLHKHHHHHHQQMNQIQHEKLDVNPHELKPNHAGTLLSYSGHSIDNRKP